MLDPLSFVNSLFLFCVSHGSREHLFSIAADEVNERP